MTKIGRYFFNILVLIDIAINVVLFLGSPYETISERCWRHRDNKYAALSVKLIDFIFFVLFNQVDHCKNSDEGLDEGKYEILGR